MKHLPIYWSNEAIRRLRAILSYIQSDSSQRALEFGAKIIKSVNRLRQFPESGRKVPELIDQEPAPREILVGEYRIIYHILPQEIQVVTIVHGRRLFPLI
ncbi:MAG: type II toxin-antitoxin system RelE/ParE family toxin [Elusimicrobia bacterium]|nr:type II toxin-antitoxin system RelE/ParE family toxin [Elusimicrobiota bacterium]